MTEICQVLDKTVFISDFSHSKEEATCFSNLGDVEARFRIDGKVFVFSEPTTDGVVTLKHNENIFVYDYFYDLFGEKSAEAFNIVISFLNEIIASSMEAEEYI